MTRGQRGAHAILWSLIAIVLAASIGGALSGRAKVDHAAREWAAKAGAR